MRKAVLAVLGLLCLSGGAAATGAPCVDDWAAHARNPMANTCHVAAVKAELERQESALNRAHALLTDLHYGRKRQTDEETAGTGIRADTAAMIIALGVVADTAAMIARDSLTKAYPGGGLIPGADYTQSILVQMRRDFGRNGWPEPASTAAAFRFLQARLRQAPQEWKAINTVADLRSGDMSAYFEPWLRDVIFHGNQQDRENHLTAKKAAYAEARETSTYLGRVWDRLTGAGRYQPSQGPVVYKSVELGLLWGGLAFVAALMSGFITKAHKIALTVAIAFFAAGLVSSVAFILTGHNGFAGAVLLVSAFIVGCPLAVRLGLVNTSGRDLFGSARWSSASEARAAGHTGRKDAPPPGFALGRLGNASPLYHKGHVLTVAPTGKGKGVGAVIPNLLDYPGSAFVLDIKGENFHVTHRQREAMGQEICLIDPFDVTGAGGQSINWLDGIDTTHPSSVAAATKLAEWIVIPTKGGGDGVHFEDTARDLLLGLILHVASLPEDRRNMPELRHLITLPMGEGEPGTFRGVLADMAASRAGFAVVARAANSFLGKPDREAGSVLSTAQRHTAFLDNPYLAAGLLRGDVSLFDLKQRPKTVYLVIPAGTGSTNSRLLRGSIGMAIASIMANQNRPEHPVAFFLDEFAQLGYMQSIEDALPVIRGYGGALWVFVQDLSQLRAVYPKWQTFLANTAQQFFGVSDNDTARYVSEALGQRTVEYSTSSRSRQPGQPANRSTSQHFTGRALATPDEVKTSRETFVFISGEHPYRLKPLNYLQDPEYAGLADPNPYHA